MHGPRGAGQGEAGAGPSLTCIGMGTRMFSQVTVGAGDPRRLARFHGAALAPLGAQRRKTAPDGRLPVACRIFAGEAAPRFTGRAPLDGCPAIPGKGRTVAFPARAAGLAAGGTAEGAPGERPHHGRGRYGAHPRDNRRVVHRGGLRG